MKKKSTDNFSKFAKKQSNAAIKEKYKQEKRKYNKEKQAFFAKKKAEEKFGKTVVDKNQTVPTPTTNAAVQKRKITNEKMPLNKFLAHAGICGRREAAAFVKQGQVKVNGNLVTEPGYKVNHNDEIKYNGKKIFLTKNLVYILLNKPKDYITTTADPQGRKTV
ncbi:MAG TPA: S4 domain-containing protein, partial [Chitinophagaceae bacterium]|nr:S4 domain-containing protein [Chitinophagaceae bacterium]